MFVASREYVIPGGLAIHGLTFASEDKCGDQKGSW
jgi:hypothetical protein